MLVFAMIHVVKAHNDDPRRQPPHEPAETAFAHTVAGAGMVEAETENIALGSVVPGLVVKVHIQVGAKVKAGQPLFALDDRHIQAELKVRQANLSAAQAQLAKLKLMPRPEEVPASAAKLAEANAVLAEKEDQYQRALILIKNNSISAEELISRQAAAKVAKAQLDKAAADLNLLKAGAWEPEVKIAEAAVLQAQSQLDQTQTELERYTVKSPVDGEALKVDVRPGEYAGAPASKALIVLGGMKVLHVRVDIDEHDIPRFQPGAPAVAKLRGNPKMELNLTFVRVEPYVVPKKALTGDNTERVDTRVLQVIYAIDQAKYPVYAGQQLDVFIQAATPTLSPK
jgi:multidrug resistance efflux pump